MKEKVKISIQLPLFRLFPRITGTKVTLEMKVLQLAKETARKAKYAVTRRSEAEKAALEATNDDKWGPANTQMQDIASMCNNYRDCEDIKKVIWERLGDTDEVRHVQKALLLLEYLVRNGPESFRGDTRAMSGQLQSLTYLRTSDVGEKGALEAVIRKKAEDLINLVNDNDLYQMEREKARKLKSSLTAVTNDGFGGSYANSTYGNYNDYGSGYGGSRYGSSRYGSSSNNFDSGYGSSNYGSSNYSSSSKPPTNPYNSSQQNDDEYEYEDEEPPQQSKQNYQQQQPQQQQQNNQFNPFTSNQPQQQRQNNQFNPFGNNQPQQQQNNQFNPFTNNQPQQQQNQFNPFQQQPQQNQFNQFGGSQQQNQFNQFQQQSNVDDLLGFNNIPTQPVQQQRPPQQQMNADDYLFGGPSQPQQRPMQQQNQAPVMDFLDLSTPAPSAPTNQNQPTHQQPKKPGMLDEFGDLVNLDLRNQKQKQLGRAGNTQLGY